MINNYLQLSALWKKGYPLILGLGLLLGGMSTQAATDCNAVTEISTVECESLLELYHSTNGANWKNNEGWNVTNTPCSWYGVICENGGVTEIRLSSNQLTGIIPNFSALPNLLELYLGNNQLTGTIPNFNALPNLQELNLYGNQLTGTIPNFSALPNLRSLALYLNQLTGTIPNFSLPNLERLTLSYNQLTGTIPNFSALPNLEGLALSGNQLTGTIPNFSALPNLQTLWLYDNQLTGTIPNFSALPNLQDLRLFDNQLTGTIPNFNALPNLDELSIHNNQLTDAIPDFSALPNLQKLYLYSNQLTGTIPNFSALPNLQDLRLFDNQLTGTIPNFSALPNLQELELWGNQLTGAIPDLDFSALTKLEFLDLRNNSICKNTNINYSSWPIKNAKDFYGIGEVEATWQEELDGFPNCPPITPVINVWPPQGMAPLDIDLDASNSEGSITQYAWTINDQTLEGPTNTTKLTEAGEHTITLTVTGNDGEITTTQQNIHVWQPGQAIIIAGPNSTDSVFKYTNEYTQRMYRHLKKRGYTDDKIHYLNITAPDIEPLDGRQEPERQDYNLFDPKKELSAAFAQATANLTLGDQFVLYLHGHAGPDRFKLLGESISATELRDLLATIPAGVQQIIILDTCYSGSFMDELKAVKHRVVVTSTNDKSLTWQISESSFAGKFMQSLEYGMDLLESYRTARTMILEDPELFGGQRPWLDDDGDGQFLNDGPYADNVHIGSRRINQAPPPEIKQVHPHITLPENEGTTTLWVKMTDNEKIYQVRAILVPPNYQVQEYQGEATDFSRIELPMLYNAVEDNYGVKYAGFCAQAGLWKILYQAQDTEGAWSKIAQGEVQAPACSSATVKMQLNKSRYTTGNPIRLDMQVNGQAMVDLYVAIIFPNGDFRTITHPLAFSKPNEIQTYQPNVEIAGQKTYSILKDFPFPELPKGQYQAYGVLVTAGAEPSDQNNWIHFDSEGFEVY
jgi:Leucine-rich repeat (LRR) protein